MNQEIKAKIKRLREDGLGYGKIAEALNISKSSVSAFCQRNGLDKEGNKPNRCKYCGKIIIRDSKTQNKVFCSPDCKRRYWNEHKDIVNKKTYHEKSCLYCHKTFSVYGKPNQKYCSFSCYLKARNGGKEND